MGTRVSEVASPGVTCVAPAAHDSLSFEFRDAHGTPMIAITFTYRREHDSWEWRINNIEDGHAIPFATLALHRR